MAAKILNKIMALIFVELLLFLPVYTSALSTANVTVEEVTDKSALIRWQTDNESTTEINYGADINNLEGYESKGAALDTNHSVTLRNLDKATEYFFELVARTLSETITDDNNGQLYDFITLAEDTIDPFIDVELPSYVDRNRIDIIGKTEISTKIEIFVNSEERFIRTLDDGDIFYRADLSPNQLNAILIKATDLAGNTFTKPFNVFSDLTAPEITLTAELPDVVDTRTLLISGTLSETAHLEIMLNNESVYAVRGNLFSFNTQLEEGINNISIIATDDVGHEAAIEKTIITDTILPTITNINPPAGSFYYEGRAIIDLEFQTEPDADVKIFLDKRGKLWSYDAAEKSGADGIVRFRDIDLEGVHFGPYSLEAEWAAVGTIPITTQTQALAYQTQLGTEASQRPVKLWAAVKDKAGHVIKQEVSYTIGTCWSGELDFLINPLQEYQSPTLLSPERLKEGSELISFVLNINYTGDAQPGEWVINDIRIDKACRGEREGQAPEFSLEHNINYDVGCKALSSTHSMKDRNTDGTLWYVRYDLGSTAAYTNFSYSLEEFASHELNFPLKLTISYKEYEFDTALNRKEWKPKTQVKCMSVAYFVDVPIDPEGVLPDWMLEDLPREMNNTIHKLDEWISGLDNITEYISMACLVSMGAKFLVQIGRKISCKLETRASFIWEKTPAGMQKGERPLCPSTDEGRMSLPLTETSRAGVTQNRPITELVRPVSPVKVDASSGVKESIYLAYRCPSCTGWWKAEENLYQLERWTCDRIFCHKAPARWTGYDKDVTDLTIKESEKKASSCATEDRAGIMPLRRIENCDREYGKYAEEPKITGLFDTEKICYQYVDSLYILKNVEPDQDGVYTLDKADKDLGEGDDTLKVLKEGNTFATAMAETCDEVCKRFDKNAKLIGDGCEPTKTGTTCSDEKPGFKEGYTAGYTQDCWISEQALDTNNPKQCCCRLPEDKEAKPTAPTQKSTKVNCQPGQTPGNDCQAWEYREQELNRIDKTKYGTEYPKNRYFDGRDAPACFGQNYLFDSPAKGEAGKVPVLDPFRQHLSAFQCLCLTGIRQRLMMIKNILTGMMNCLISIRVTGEADAGVCKELFTQYICDVFYQVFTWFKQGCIPLPFGKEITLRGIKGQGSVGTEGVNIDAESAFEIGLGSAWETITGMGDSLESEYGSSQFSSYLQMGEKEVARKICLSAFGFDVGLDFDTLLDLTYQTQFRSSALGLGLRRDYLTYNPDNGLSTYAYRGAWTIYPGCEISNYKIDLACINLEERSKYPGIDCSVPVNPDNREGCDCLYSAEPYSLRSKTFYIGNALSAESLEDKSHHMNVDSLYRYDHIRLQLMLGPDSDPNKCLPEGHDDGIFYFPISDLTAKDIIDCEIDQRGSFRCTRGLEWEQKGEAVFETFSSSECHSYNSCSLLCKDPNPEKDEQGRDILWRDCNSVVYSPGNTITVKPKINGKKKQCLKATVTSESGNKVYDEIFKIGEIGLEQSYIISNTEFRLSQVRTNEFAATGMTVVSETPDVCQISRVEDRDTEPKTPNLQGIITIVSEGNNNFRLTTLPSGTKTYTSETNPAELTTPITGAESVLVNHVFIFGGFAFKFTNIEAGDCRIRTKTATGEEEQDWQLHLELLYPDVHGNCGRTTERIFKVGYETDIDKTLEVHRRYVNTCNRLKGMRANDLQGKLVYKSGGDVTAPNPSAQFVNYSCRPSNYNEDSVIIIKTGQTIDGESKICSGTKVCATPGAAIAAPAAVAAVPGAAAAVPGAVDIIRTVHLEYKGTPYAEGNFPVLDLNDPNYKLILGLNKSYTFGQYTSNDYTVIFKSDFIEYPFDPPFPPLIELDPDSGLYYVNLNYLPPIPASPSIPQQYTLKVLVLDKGSGHNNNKVLQEKNLIIRTIAPILPGLGPSIPTTIIQDIKIYETNQLAGTFNEEKTITNDKVSLPRTLISSFDLNIVVSSQNYQDHTFSFSRQPEAWDVSFGEPLITRESNGISSTFNHIPGDPRNYDITITVKRKSDNEVVETRKLEVTLT